MHYAYAAQTKESAIEKFTEDHGEGYTSCDEIPESEWDEKIISIHEDNDFDKEPFKVSIRESIVGTKAQELFTNDLSFM
jgi:hypothetical protein